MTQTLAGQTVLITGGARRLGAATAHALHAAGANVVIHHLTSTQEAGTLIEALNQSRANSATAVQADLLDVARLPGLIAAAVSRFGRLDILVNNASTFYPTPIGAISGGQFDDLIGTNLRAPLFLAQAAAPELRRRRGLILNMVDIHGMKPLKDYPVYSSAKAALIMLTKALARELAPDVRVNGIAPGPVMWPADLDAAMQAQIIDKTLLKRAGEPQDIGKAALYFATMAPYVTGQILAVDGGRSQCG
ncbi:MAG TPA: pteridine reductase [Steroidobacteraceae bacterium]|jgi:pteridine reductase|nr:pteridine reductase [Steroidobacteraceae bacterium]